MRSPLCLSPSRARARACNFNPCNSSVTFFLATTNDDQVDKPTTVLSGHARQTPRSRNNRLRTEVRYLLINSLWKCFRYLAPAIIARKMCILPNGRCDAFERRRRIVTWQKAMKYRCTKAYCELFYCIYALMPLTRRVFICPRDRNSRKDLCKVIIYSRGLRVHRHSHATRFITRAIFGNVPSHLHRNRIIIAFQVLLILCFANVCSDLQYM